MRDRSSAVGRPQAQGAPARSRTRSAADSGNRVGRGEEQPASASKPVHHDVSDQTQFRRQRILFAGGPDQRWRFIGQHDGNPAADQGRPRQLGGGGQPRMDLGQSFAGADPDGVRSRFPQQSDPRQLRPHLRQTQTSVRRAHQRSRASDVGGIDQTRHSALRRSKHSQPARRRSACEQYQKRQAPICRASLSRTRARARKPDDYRRSPGDVC